MRKISWYLMAMALASGGMTTHLLAQDTSWEKRPLRIVRSFIGPDGKESPELKLALEEALAREDFRVILKGYEKEAELVVEGRGAIHKITYMLSGEVTLRILAVTDRGELLLKSTTGHSAYRHYSGEDNIKSVSIEAISAAIGQHLWERRSSGEGITVTLLSNTINGVPVSDTEDLLYALSEKGYLVRTDNGGDIKKPYFAVNGSVQRWDLGNHLLYVNVRVFAIRESGSELVQMATGQTNCGKTNESDNYSFCFRDAYRIALNQLNPYRWSRHNELPACPGCVKVEPLSARLP